MMKVERIKKENQDNDDTKSDISLSTTKKKKDERCPISNNCSIDPDDIGDNSVLPATTTANPQELPISQKMNKDLPVTNKSNLMP